MLATYRSAVPRAASLALSRYALKIGRPLPNRFRALSEGLDRQSVGDNCGGDGAEPVVPLSRLIGLGRRSAVSLASRDREPGLFREIAIDDMERIGL